MFYTSNLLHHGKIVHGFFGRKGGVSTGMFSALNCNMRPGEDAANVEANRNIACNRLGLELNQLHMVKQVHSNIVYLPHGLPQNTEADALVTNTPGVALAIQTADCTPIMFADQKNSVIGIAHAGWRGALSGIIGETVAAMVKLGANTNTITAIIGPTIQQDTYEVDSAFKDGFLKQHPENSRFFIDGKAEGKYMFNLPGYCANAIMEQGISEIDDLRINTYSNPADFFSYRRATHEGAHTCGGQVSIICLK